MQWVSTSKSVSMKALAEQGALGGVIVRLMMVLQDCGFANRGMRMLGKPTRKKRQGDIRRAAGRYFLRLQVSHTREGLRIIQNIRDSKELSGLLMACDKRTKKAFAELEAVLGQSDYALIKTIRDKVSFHYDSDMVKRSLRRMESRRMRQVAKKGRMKGLRKPIDLVTLSVENELHKSKFVPWEAVENDIIMHEIFKLRESDTYEDDKKLDAAADAIVVRLHEIQRKFSFFAVNFIAKYARS